jgi:pyruvate kinase
VKAPTKMKIRAIITDASYGRISQQLNLRLSRQISGLGHLLPRENGASSWLLSYGVEAIYMPELANGQEYIFRRSAASLKEGRCNRPIWREYLSSGKVGTQSLFP